MKYSCEIIRDLMPLYCDEVCSKDSAEAVAEHIKKCEECNRIYREMKKPDEISEMMQKEAYEEQEVSSMKKVKKKWNKKKRWTAVIGIGIGATLVYLCRKVIVVFGLVGLLTIESAFSEIEVHDDIAQYEGYIHYGSYENAKNGMDKKYSKYTHCGMDMSIFPETITKDMEMREFQFTYYNPWDAQYISYLTVAYDDTDYAGEMARLAEIGIGNYTWDFKAAHQKMMYYGVTGAPEGYELAALSADDYYGYVYAIVPENEDNTITYVEITFCNYFLDLDIHEYLPDKYLLEGFDATIDNPYRALRTSGKEENGNL